MSEIKVGDVVVLKSGGPKMTVSGMDKEYMGGDELHVWCDWFVQDKAPWKKGNGVFPLTSVKLAE